MKALILAAGFGTRLKPYTDIVPKPLFPIDGRPIIDITISKLINAGCSGIIINTHHLGTAIEHFIKSKHYPVPVETRYEPEILDTGGAIKNVSDFWDEDPFLVVNSDIVTDIDYKKVYRFHLAHANPATLVLHDYKEFNNVSVDENGFIRGFHLNNSSPWPKLAFTGIQVLDSAVVDLIPENTFYSSIDLYRNLIAEKSGVKSMTERCYWIDIGSPDKYKKACCDEMAPQAFKKAFTTPVDSPIHSVNLKGDGSDRTWYRLSSGKKSVILGDHNINTSQGATEAKSFINIGQHLFHQRLQVPEIYHYDTFSGQVFMEDLGDIDLETTVKQSASTSDIISHYKKVLDLLVGLSTKGGKGFDSSWPYQSERYDRNIIIENECRYFINAFINGVVGLHTNPDDLEEEFSDLADKALHYQYQGFMHRDFQSRNIMVRDNRFYCIDFQGGRIGPVQYDLASLLIDPYVNLPDSVRNELEEYFITRYSQVIATDRDTFLEGYKYLKLTRNLQMLGAFGFLSKVKGKTYFEEYIPAALTTLKSSVSQTDSTAFVKLKKIIEKI